MSSLYVTLREQTNWPRESNGLTNTVQEEDEEEES